MLPAATVGAVLAFCCPAIAQGHAGPAIAHDHAGPSATAHPATTAATASESNHDAALDRFGPEFARFAHAMNADMARMTQQMHAAGFSGSPDVDFLAMMIAHHQGAVDMARQALIHGRDPLVRRLAEEIIASQSTEIAAMRARLARLKTGADADPDGFPALGSTRGRPAAPAAR